MNGNDIADGMLVYIVVAIVVTIIVFLIFREIICWYWKINRNVELLTEIRGETNRNVALLTEIRDLLAVKENSQDGVAPVAQQNPSSISECDIPFKRDADSIKLNPKVDYTDKFAEKWKSGGK